MNRHAVERHQRMTRCQSLIGQLISGWVDSTDCLTVRLSQTQRHATVIVAFIDSLYYLLTLY